MIGNYIFGLQVDNKFCEKVIKENDSLDIENATVESKNDKRRSSKISWVPLENNPKALQQLIGEANKLYKFSLQEFEQLQYTRYEKDDHYDWHVDTHSKPYSNGMIRKLSFTILLNDEFEGGNFDIWNGHPISEKSEVKSYALKKGEMIVFPSHTWHRVNKVTSGVRKALVGWLVGKQWI